MHLKVPGIFRNVTKQHWDLSDDQGFSITVNIAKVKGWVGRVISLAHADGDGFVGVGKPTCVSKDAPHNAMYTLSRLPASQIISRTSMHVLIRVNSA